MQMNNDGSMQLKLVERIINSTSLLYIDKYRRQRFKQTKEPFKLRHQNTVLDELRSDFTKPIWPLNMNYTPDFVCGLPPKNQPSSPFQASIAEIDSLFYQFAYRLKNEHEDESSIRINLDVLDHTLTNEITDNQIKANFSKLYDQLYKIQRIRAATNESVFEKNQEDNSQIGALQWNCSLDAFFISVLQKCLKSDDSIKKSLLIWIKQFNKYLCRILDSQSTSTIFTITPRIDWLSLAIHPILLAIYNNIMTQVNFQYSKRPQNQNREKDKFQDIKYQCSKIVFVNLDGYESEHNIDVARAMCRQLMYISFPRESYVGSESKMMDEQESLKGLKTSQRMLSRYFRGRDEQTKTQEEVKGSYVVTEMKELNKNIFVFPVYSRFLSEEEKRSIKSIKEFESNFIYYMFKELLTNQINDFNPSVVIISYSGKLTIQNRHYIEMIKQLVKLGNYKVILFPNLIKQHLFKNIDSEDNQYEEITQGFLKEYNLDEQGIYLNKNGQINVDLLEKISIFTKISSGTFNLYPLYEQQSAIEKYRNGNVLGYASELLDFMKNEFQTIKKVHFRSGQLASVSEVTKKEFEELMSNPTFKETFSKFQENLLKKLEDCLAKPPTQYKDLVEQILNIYPKDDRLRQAFEIFKFQYQLSVMYQRLYKKIYMVIKNKSPQDNTVHHNYKNLIAKYFEIHDGQRSQSIDIFTHSRLLYDHQNRSSSEKPIVYLTNHLFKNNYSNFVGRILKNDNRVQLRQVTMQYLDKNQYSDPMTILTDWNYHQTNKYVFFYWPQKYDLVKVLLCKLAKVPYVPEIESIVFRATVEKPELMIQLTITQNEMRPTLPRYGCSAYSFQSGNQTHMFVFGGFYKNQDNYLKFQNNMDRFTFTDNKTEINNVSKGKKLDAIRPRTYYEVLEYQPQGDRKKIAIIGGYGQVFSRPYSLMSSIYYIAEFDTRSGDILSIVRQTIEPIRVNVQKPIKIRNAVQMQVMADDDSRTTRKRTINSDGYSFHNTQYILQKNQIKQQKTSFQFGLIQHLVYRQQVQQIKRSPEQNNIQDTKLKFHRGVRNFTNTVTLFIDSHSYIFVIMFQTQHDSRMKHPNLQERVHVTSESILALTNHHTYIYALLRHPVYTMSKCILAEFNMSAINNTTINSDKDQELLLQESHRFRLDVSRHAIMVVKPKFIAVLHGPKHIKSKRQVNEFILKKTRTINQTPINPCPDTLLPLPRKSQSLPILSSTLFQKIEQSLHCYSFGTVQDTSFLYLHVKLNLAKQYTWEKIHQFQAQLNFPELKAHPNPKLKVIDFRNITVGEKYELVVMLEGVEYVAGVGEKEIVKEVKFEKKNGEGSKEQLITVLDKRLAYRDFQEEEDEGGDDEEDP